MRQLLFVCVCVCVCVCVRACMHAYVAFIDNATFYSSMKYHGWSRDYHLKGNNSVPQVTRNRAYV